jgi:hypothetical protein
MADFGKFIKKIAWWGVMLIPLRATMAYRSIRGGEKRDSRNDKE